jgi:hypothetical protein
VFDVLDAYRKRNNSAYLVMMTARLQTIGYGARAHPEAQGTAQVQYRAILHPAIV